MEMPQVRGQSLRALPNGVDLCQSHWRLGIMTWKGETSLSEWSLQMLL